MYQRKSRMTVRQQHRLLEHFVAWHGGAARRPIGVALWAFVSAEVEARLKAGHKRLQPAEWKGGDRPMLVELVAPFGLQEKMIENLARSVFKGKGFGLAQQATERGASPANGSAGEK